MRGYNNAVEEKGGREEKVTGTWAEQRRERQLAEQQEKRMNRVLCQIKAEYHRAIAKFKEFNSAHEGYAVIKEELDELWDEIKKKKETRGKVAMKEEAIQVATMALRFIVDLVEEDKLDD